MCSVRGADVGFMIKANLYIPSTKNTQMNLVILLYVKSVYFYIAVAHSSVDSILWLCNDRVQPKIPQLRSKKIYLRSLGSIYINQ